MELASKLNQRIIIQRWKEHDDEHGISREEWLDLKTVWCKANNLFGKEYWSAKEYNSENTVEFVIRYNACKDLSVKDRIKFKGKIYNISSVDNILYKNESIKIRAMEVL